MNRWKKGLIAGAVTLGLGSGMYMPAAQAASPWEILFQGAASMAYVSTALSKIDDTDEGQAEMLKETKRRTGFYDNPAYQERVDRILGTLEASPQVKRDYVVYVVPDPDINAFMTFGRVMAVNTGTMDAMDDNELAYVMAHEIGHGEHKDLVHGAKKSVGLATAIGMATSGADGAGQMLGGIIGQYMENQVFTMGQEKDADKLGFVILADSPYNLGGAPSSMAVIKAKYGDLYHEGLSKVLSPNNHPKTSDRIRDNVKRMYEYSRKQVDVKDKTVYLNKQAVYTGTTMGRYTDEMRAFLVAGKLARLAHDNQLTATSVNGNQVMMGTMSLVTADNADEAFKVSTAINNALTKKK